MHRIFPGDGWLVVLDIRVASGQAFAFESRFAEMGRPTGMPVALRELPQRVQSGFQRSRPPDIPPPHHRGDSPGSAGVPPACYPVACRSVSLRCGTRPPCRRERHGPGRSRVLAPLPVDPGGGDDRGCAKTCAGGTPALPGGLHPMTSSHQRRFIGLRVHLCSFVVRLY